MVFPKGVSGNPDGAPSRYEEEYIKKVDKYLALRVDKEVPFVERERTTKLKNKKKKTYLVYGMKFKVNLPTIEGFAEYLGVARKSLYNWEKEHKKFRIALDKIRNEQKERLINMGLSGDYNSTIAKLILSSNYGMKERIDATTGDEPITSFNDEQIDRIAERIAERKRSDGDAPSQEKSD